MHTPEDSKQKTLKSFLFLNILLQLPQAFGTQIKGKQKASFYLFNIFLYLLCLGFLEYTTYRKLK